MKAATVEALVWVLIYGGLLVAALGLFLRGSQPVAATILIVIGLAGAATGAWLIWWRYRMKPDPKETP